MTSRGPPLAAAATSVGLVCVCGKLHQGSGLKPELKPIQNASNGIDAAVLNQCQPLFLACLLHFNLNSAVLCTPEAIKP
jgi:hypothetical protein